MRVEEIMTRDVTACGLEDTLADAARKMWEKDCGSVPVIDAGGRARAMITDRDISMAALHQGRPITEIHVADAMSKTVVTCGPHDDVDEAQRVMQQHQIRHLPVVDGDGVVVGVLSLNDLANEAARQQMRRDREITTADVASTLARISEHREPRPEPPPPSARKPRRATT